MNITRENSMELLKKHVDSESLIKHSMAVEGSMIGYAKHFDGNIEEWASCGLLHDMDYEKHPEEHPIVGVKVLEDAGYPDIFVDAIKGHADFTDTPRDTQMAKTLYAVDELSSFIIAVALVRPTKLEGLTPKSVKKKMKDKAFARAVDRDMIKKGAEEFGVDLTEHIANIINFLTEHEAVLNERGLSLL